jgi:hypothetical protein
MRLGRSARASAAGSAVALVLLVIWSLWRGLPSDTGPPLAMFFAAMLALFLALGLALSGLIAHLPGASTAAGLAVAAALGWFLITLVWHRR